MAEHIWSVLCSKGLVDKSSNLVSLIEVVENLTITLTEQIPAGAREAALSLSFVLVSYWIRSDSKAGENVAGRVRTLGPGEQSLSSSEFEVSLMQHSRARHFMRFASMPYDGAGMYRFVVEQRVGDGWRQVASVPLQLEIKHAPVDTAATVTPTP